jgi:hypothetical protein
LLRAFIQLPMMTSVLACVSSMGGTGYLQARRRRHSHTGFCRPATW